MKNKTFARILCLLLLILLSAAMAISMVGCTQEPETPEGTDASAIQKVFTVEVFFADGSQKTVELQSDKTTVGEALLEQGILAGEDGPYGLMIQSVYGERHVYEEGGTYWAFYINGEYAMSGVDSTDIVDGSVYAFKVE